MYDENRAKEELKDILNQKEYQVYYEDNRNFIEVWWDNLKNWLGDLLGKFFSSFNPSNNAAEGILVLTILVFVLLALFFLVRYNLRRQKDMRDNKPIQSTNELNWSYHNHLIEAQKQEGLTQYSIAARHLFLALLLYFHEKEWLEARIWKTNWEYYDELYKVNKNRAEQFYSLAVVFDEAAYGKRTIKQVEYIQYKNKIMNWLEEKDNHAPLQG
ncbi:DUF4129 domain-containing protein [Virgibacillus sp. DJP39]|uniref:DUF4129 domain-containing protein n=1 Tax=Virgibacillus sp. DJP39 TaxID=3409790 RepID=UPI003BB4C999